MVRITSIMDNKVSAIQTQLNGKQATITGGATTITSSNLTANRALISSNNGKVAVSNISNIELGYLSGVTSAIQTQLNGKLSLWTSGNCARISKLQICWGITNSENISTINLPQAFKDTSYVVVGLPMQGSANTSDLYVHSKTTTQFKLQEYAQKAEQRNWLAIGYWQ